MRVPTLAYLFGTRDDLGLSSENRGILLYSLSSFMVYDFYSANVAPVSAQMRAVWAIKAALDRAGQSHRAHLLPRLDVGAAFCHRILLYIITRSFYLVILAFVFRVAILAVFLALRLLQYTSAQADSAISSAEKATMDRSAARHEDPPLRSDATQEHVDASVPAPNGGQDGLGLPPFVRLQSFLNLATITAVLGCISFACAAASRDDDTPVIAGTIHALQSAIPWQAGALILLVGFAVSSLAITPFIFLSAFNIWLAWSARRHASVPRVAQWLLRRNSAAQEPVGVPNGTGASAVEDTLGGKRKRTVNGRVL
ncbi:hypothetical protein HDZ31DRAFT_84935 [Schizophyllum fasciatum]